MAETNGHLGNGRSPPRKVCRNCLRPWHSLYKMTRGLCRACYQTPGIRAQFAPLKSGRRGGEKIEGFGLDNYRLGDPSLWEPTTCPPGTVGKLRVMMFRVKIGLPIFHPMDAKREDFVPSAEAGALEMMSQREIDEALGEI